MKKQVIAYVHSHWDREWYREFEIFRMRLLRVFDNVLNMLASEELPSFYFDGQTTALIDYLEIRPEKEAQIRKFIEEKKLFIGPFYCLVDEFLTDENCFRKNLEIGLKIAKDFGCEDFVGYFADTFGHSASIIPILKEYGIDTAIVWRGCGDLQSEFVWKNKTDAINTINLVRGYFNDVFSAPWNIEKKAEFLKTNLDKISEKSGDVLLLPIGADHLGVETDLSKQINEVNSLLNDYEIKFGTIFDYITKVKSRFPQCIHEGELRDNSKTFVLEGCYSSRLDIKKYNVNACHKLDIAESLVKYKGYDNYLSLIEYAYKLLLQNQAHDSICGCSTDDVHNECITRYKKVLQIAETIVDELSHNGNKTEIINLSDTQYSGLIKFESSKKLSYQITDKKKGFDKNLLVDTQRIPMTEDYTEIYTYAICVNNIKQGKNVLNPTTDETDLFITDSCIGNSHIYLSIENGNMTIGDKIVRFVDFQDNGDSYNTGYVFDDKGIDCKILSSKIIRDDKTLSTLGLKIDAVGDLLDVNISLSKQSNHLNFEINWINSRKNHLLEFVIDTAKPIETTLSEDFSNIIERTFNPEYNVRNNLPKEKGIEVQSSNAPMHRGVCANGIGVVTFGLTQYEIYQTELRLPILRATGQISNPNNPSRTTPAGPPIDVDGLQQLGKNNVRFNIFLGNNLKEQIDNAYNKCVVI